MYTYICKFFFLYGFIQSVTCHYDDIIISKSITITYNAIHSLHIADIPLYITVEPLYRGHFGTSTSVLNKE